MQVLRILDKRFAAFAACALAMCACLFAFTACGANDKPDLIGEWKVANTEVTVVFSDTQFKVVGNTFDYTIDSGNKTITYTAGGAKGTSKYSFSADKQQLTLEESSGKTTVFNKVSSNGNAEPSAGVAATPAPEMEHNAAAEPQPDPAPEADQGGEGQEGGSE